MKNNSCWPKDFISEKDLRKDIEIMIESAKAVLLKTFKKKIVGIYFKGSASKKWDSPIDYVPEVSDIDIHVLLDSQESWNKAFPSVEKSMDFSGRIEKEYYKRNKKPAHYPLLQVLSLNEMKTEAEYIPSLHQFVRVIYGAPYEGYFKEHHSRDFRKRAIIQILENEPAVSKIKKRGVYKYGKNLSKYIDELSWRLSSMGPNYLCMKGYSYEDAWFLNRTTLVKHLKKVGSPRLAGHYRNFYMDSWKYFMTKDTKYCRAAVIEGCKVISQMASEAKDDSQ